MNVRKLTLVALVACLSMVLWGCHMGMGPRGGGHYGHNGHNGHNGHHGAPGPTDHYAVQFAPYQDVQTVKCPVCSGSGQLQRPYICQPAPVNPHISP